MRLLLSLLLLLAATGTFTVAQDRPADNPAIEMMALYKQAERSWSYKIINSVHGEEPDVSTSTTRITAVDGSIARCTTETSSGNGSSFSSSNFTVDTSVVPEEAKAWAAAEVPMVKLDMGFATFECKKHQRKADGIQVTTWVSTEFHPLVVKRVTFESASTSVHKLTSFQAATVNPWMLYRKEGRRWKTRMTINAGGKSIINYTEYTVKAVRDDGATYSMATLDANGKAMFTQDQEMKFTTPGVAVPAGRAPQATMESKECEAGEFQCNLMDLNGTKSWTSVQWPMLLVAMESNTLTMELVEFDIGHDEHLFYRTKGNRYALTQTVTVGGDTVKSVIRREVTSVEGPEVTWTHKQFDDKGNVVVNGEETLTLPEEQETVAYAGEFEELIETPVGTFPALRTDLILNGEKSTGSGKSWSWNGIVIREETIFDGVESITELTELNLE